jgi:hypothetical protein
VRPTKPFKPPSPEKETIKIQLDRMESNIHRIRELFDMTNLTKEQMRKLIAEELVMLQETNKSCMRVVFDI